MDTVVSSLKSLTFVHALVAAVVLVLAAMFAFKSGIVNSLLWLAALVLLIVGVVNYVSYKGQG